ncbi:hypothetical protein MJA45_06045 [Paenibacillus aurantius]|uniref:Flagellar protein n=1 Tax=Paenibacillus aurantius TaxID=2918900 RepID=A0AA96LG33_9BACL|nr:hypothetical protein [Paenibacillus aurantius]WNQ12589.1 hypothetical protein MJA45_06045 [Paenibacillus aurantius]
MALSNCKQCGKLFLRQKSAYCRDCQAANDEYYFELRRYIKAHPNSTMLEIHEKTGIPLAKLLELQRQDYAPFGA